MLMQEFHSFDMRRREALHFRLDLLFPHDPAELDRGVERILIGEITDNFA